MKDAYLKIYRAAQPYLDTRQNDLHTRISYSFALKLLEVEGGDEGVILPAILLHDVGWKMIPEHLHLLAFGPGTYDKELNRVHELEGAKKAREILQSLDYAPEMIEEVATIISGHDSRTEALSLNDAIVKDADKLWRYSKEAREVDCSRFNVDRQTHWEWLGRQIEGWFFTQTAVKLAREQLGSAQSSCQAGESDPRKP